MEDITKLEKNLGYFIKQVEKAFVSLYCDSNMNDAISTGKIPENTRLRLVLSLGIYSIRLK